MLTDFFYHLRVRRLPVSVQEYLSLLEALRCGVMPPTIDDFYYLARAILVKDESLFDRYDQAFGEFYWRIEAKHDEGKAIPADWLVKAFEKKMNPEEKAALEKQCWQGRPEKVKERGKE